VSLDLGAIYNGVCTDAAETVAVGNVEVETQALITATKKSLAIGIGAIVEGSRIGDIGHAIQTYIEPLGYEVVRDLVGHGIGTKPHTDPQIPNYGNAKSGPVIKNHTALAIEPMVTMGSYEIYTDDDDWTIRTNDGSLAAHFEHTVVIIDHKPVIVTI